MGTQSEKKPTIFYIGSDERVIESFSGSGDAYRFIHKPNPLEAVGWFEKNPIVEAILCEKELPGRNGIDFHQLFLKEYDKKNQIPYIILAAAKDRPTIRQAFQQKVDDIYIKPVNPEVIYNRVKFLKRLKPEVDMINMESDQSDIHIYKTPFFKRVFDVFFASLALLVASPLLLLFIIAIRLESKGKVYYVSKRVGTGYHIFNFLKLRSMYTDADRRLHEFGHLNQYQNKPDDTSISSTDHGKPEAGHGSNKGPMLFGDDFKVEESAYIEGQKTKKERAFVKFENDPRITKIGEIIRMLSIDELPQLINVIKRDMSIVGNRPLPLYEAELLTTDEWTNRFNGPAGITGLWQVEARGKTAIMSPEERKQLDNKYVEIAQSRFSFWKDIWIILRTISAIFQKKLFI